MVSRAARASGPWSWVPPFRDGVLVFRVTDDTADPFLPSEKIRAERAGRADLARVQPAALDEIGGEVRIGQRAPAECEGGAPAGGDHGRRDARGRGRGARNSRPRRRRFPAPIVWISVATARWRATPSSGCSRGDRAARDGLVERPAEVRPPGRDAQRQGQEADAAPGEKPDQRLGLGEVDPLRLVGIHAEAVGEGDHVRRREPAGDETVPAPPRG